MNVMHELLRFSLKIVIVAVVASASMFAILIVGVLILAAVITDGSGQTQTVFGPDDASRTFLSIPVKGVIEGERPTSEPLFSTDTTYGYEVKKQLYEAAKDDSIDGVILEIDSPGGTIYGARAIADGITHYRDVTRKPIVAYISGMGASGAYWAAAAADEIVADYGTTVGSIGVIEGPFKFYNTPTAEDGGLLAGGVVTQNGIENVTLTAGKSKDLGNPYRRLTPDEINVLQNGLNTEYGQFVQFVGQRRGITEATIRDQVGALIYDPTTAVTLKLIDKVGAKEDAYAELAAKAQVDRTDIKIIQEPDENGSGGLLGVLGTKTKPTASTRDRCYLSSLSLVFYGDVTSFCIQKQ